MNNIKNEPYRFVRFELLWRRERGSNPCTVLAVTRFPIVRLQPAQPPLRVFAN